MPLPLADAKEDASHQPKPTDDEGDDGTPRRRRFDGTQRGGTAHCNVHTNDPEQRCHRHERKDEEVEILVLLMRIENWEYFLH